MRGICKLFVWTIVILGVEGLIFFALSEPSKSGDFIFISKHIVSPSSDVLDGFVFCADNSSELVVGDHDRGSVVVSGYYLPEKKSLFSLGICLGTIKGLKEGFLEFVPEMLETLSDVGYMMWSFCDDPRETFWRSADFVLYCVDYIKVYSIRETFEVIIPEMEDVNESWNNVGDYGKGLLAGDIIGIYAMDFLGFYLLDFLMSMMRCLGRINRVISCQVAKPIQ